MLLGVCGGGIKFTDSIWPLRVDVIKFIKIIGFIGTPTINLNTSRRVYLEGGGWGWC